MDVFAFLQDSEICLFTQTHGTWTSNDHPSLETTGEEKSVCHIVFQGSTNNSKRGDGI